MKSNADSVTPHCLQANREPFTRSCYIAATLSWSIFLCHSCYLHVIVNILHMYLMMFTIFDSALFTSPLKHFPFLELFVKGLLHVNFTLQIMVEMHLQEIETRERKGRQDRLAILLSNNSSNSKESRLQTSKCTFCGC